jgi:DNA-binding transcriptional MocR family regulator
VEAPTYGHLLPLLRFHGLKPLTVPQREDGLDLDALAHVMRRDRPALVFTMPSFQNPTGICTPQAHRERLLTLCERHRTPLIEDGYEEEMQYAGRVVLAVKSMDRSRVVVYLGTFSKALFAGARVGWVVADRPCIERLAALRRFADLGSSTLLQAALHRFCVSGAYDRHLSRMHRAFRRRMAAALAALRELVPSDLATWAEPRGGYLIWLRLGPAVASGAALEERLAARRVLVAHGRQFFAGRPSGAYLRLSIASLDEDEIREGIRRLARALTDARRPRRGKGGQR